MRSKPLKERIRQQAKQQLVMVTDLSQDRVRAICDETAPTCKSFGNYSTHLVGEQPYEDDSGYFRLYDVWGPGHITKMMSFRMVIRPAGHAMNPRAAEDKPDATFVATEIKEFFTTKPKMGGLITTGPEKITVGFKGYLRFTNRVAERVLQEDPDAKVRMLPR